MKSTRPIVVLAAVAVASLALQGCSGASEGGDTGEVDGAGKTLDVLVAANTNYPDEQKQWFSDVSDRFEEKTGATVAFETFATANDELTKIQTSVLSGQGPDVYSLGTTFTPTAYSTGAFVPLTDTEWDKVGGRDRFTEATLGISGPDEDNEVGIPFASRPFVMAYNTELLAAAGIDAPADSWDGLVEQSKQLTSGDVYGMAIAYADSFDPWKFIWGMSLQAGNPLVDGKEATIDDPATKLAYETYFSWVTDEAIVDPAAVAWKSAQSTAAFASGKAAFLPMTSATSRNTLDASPVAGKYAYALLPTIPPGETEAPDDSIPAASIISGDNMVVADYSTDKDLAFALIEMITSAEEQQGYFELFGDLPTNADAAEAIQAEDPLLAPIVEAASQSVGTPFTGAWGDIQLALVNVVVQEIPALESGRVEDSELDSRLAAAQEAAQASLDRAK